jgi:hypothetical protein
MLDPLTILQTARAEAQAQFSILHQREDWLFVTDLLNKTIDWVIGMSPHVAIKHTPVSCECDGDGSRYCPLHDDCESCGERLGAIKDPDWKRTPAEKRPMWLCLLCAVPYMAEGPEDEELPEREGDSLRTLGLCEADFR